MPWGLPSHPELARELLVHALSSTPFSQCLSQSRSSLAPSPLVTLLESSLRWGEGRTMSGFLFTEEGWEWWGIIRVYRPEKQGSPAKQRSGWLVPVLSPWNPSLSMAGHALPRSCVCATHITAQATPSPLPPHPLCTHLCTVTTGLPLCHSLRMASVWSSMR